jgi:elongation factor P
MQVIDFQHVQPGRGAAFVRTKLKSLTSGKTLDNTFQGSAKIDVVRVETREYQFLYTDELGYNFMNTDTFEQVSVPEHVINAPQFLREGMICQIQFNAEEESPMSCELPSFIEAEITYTEPGIKGDTATNTLKPATIDINNVQIRVPLFINQGDKVRVDTRTGDYHDRLSKG